MRGAARRASVPLLVAALVAAVREPAWGGQQPGGATVSVPGSAPAPALRAQGPAGARPLTGGATLPAPRALWVVRNSLESSEETARAVEDCARIGCSLLLLQVSGRWDAYFPSEVFPRGQSLAPAEGDNLAQALRLAHARGIRVHAWVNALLAWSAPDPPREADHVFHRHPSWFLVGPDGRSVVRLSRRELDARGVDGYFLEPRVPEVRTALRRFVLDLVTRYDVDGVHLDYVRFPSAGWGFQPELRKRYRAETGIDPRDLYVRERELAASRGAVWLADARVAWQAWHREGVTQLVRLIAGDLRAVRPGLELSAAVLADPRSARDDFGQDWVAWLGEGILDLAVPMAYRPSAKQVLELVERIGRAVDPGARYFVGVSLASMAAGEIPPIEHLMGRYGADGLAIFSYNLLRASPRMLRELSGS